MTSIAKHPLTQTGIVLCVSGAVAYFGVIRNIQDDQLIHKEWRSKTEQEVIDVRKLSVTTHSRLNKVEQDIIVLTGLSPRVTALETSVNNLQVEIGKQSVQLNHIQDGLKEIKGILNGK